MAVAMTIPEILEQLTSLTGHFPREAVVSAIEQKDAITPHLLAALQEVAEDPDRFAGQDDYMLHLFGMYLLAHFHEKRAFPIAIRIASAPAEVLGELIGEDLAETMATVLASTYGGDWEPLRSLIEDSDADEGARSGALRAVVILARSGQVPAAEVKAYFKSLFRGKLPREDSSVWDELAVGVAALPAPELLEDLRQAYKQGWVNPQVVGLQEIEHDLKVGPGPEHDRLFAEYTLGTDVVAELESWVCFGE